MKPNSESLKSRVIITYNCYLRFLVAGIFELSLEISYFITSIFNCFNVSVISLHSNTMYVWSVHYLHC